MKTVGLSFVDREGNRKAVSLDVPETVTDEDVATFAESVQGFSCARMMTTNLVPSAVVVEDVYTAGVHDLVGEVARLRFVDEENKAFSFSIPAPIDGFLDANEEVSAGSAALVVDAIEALTGETPHYRGGRLIVKKVSEPLLIPVIP
jgi:hypothetical protein